MTSTPQHDKRSIHIALRLRILCYLFGYIDTKVQHKVSRTFQIAVLVINEYMIGITNSQYC